MQFAKKTKAGADIPTASLPDIIFMLLIFFMVVTVFKEFNGLPVLLPAARTTEKLESKRNIAYLWADKLGRVSVDDKIVTMDDIEPIMAEKFAGNRRIIISMKIDKDVEMGLVTDIQEQLRDAYTLRVSYATRLK
ncbi:biopolymer transporter ExbD [bacterium]|nr:biopolymer transporter ExbD [bacterium]